MARVLFVNRFYWPDEPATGQLLTDLAEGLANRGHEVTVIASRPVKDPARTEHNGVAIVHVGSTRRDGAGAVSKALDWATFLLGAFWKIWRHADRNMVVVAMTDPPLLAVAAWIAVRIRAAR